MKNISLKNVFIVAAFASTILFMAGFGPCDWFRNKFGCSDCATHKEHSYSGQPSKSDDSDQESSENGGSSQKVSVKISDSKKTSKPSTDDIIAEFTEPKSYELVLNLTDDQYLDVDTINSELSGIAPMFNFKELPPQHQYEVAKELFETICARRIMLEKYLQDESFAMKLKNVFKSLLRMLISQKIGEDLMSAVTVSESDIKKEYESNKMRFIQQLGGVRTLVAECSSEDEAETFKSTLLEKNVNSDAEFMSVAKDSGLSPMDYNYVSREFSRGIDNAIVDAIEQLNGSTPDILIVKGKNDKYWVVLAAESRETKYRSLDESRKDIENLVKRNIVLAQYRKTVSEMAADAGGKFLLKPQSANAPYDFMQAFTKQSENNGLDDDSDMDSDEDMVLSDIDSIASNDTARDAVVV